MSSYNYQEIADQFAQIKNRLLDCATGGKRDSDAEKDYKVLREKLLRIYYTAHDKSFETSFPEIVKNCQTLNAFWNTVKTKFQHYSERRKYLDEMFLPIEQCIESRTYAQSSKEIIIEPVNILSLDYIEKTINKAKDRVRIKDYDGAITTSRTLVAEVEDALYRNLYGKEPDEKTRDNALHKAVMDGLKMNIKPSLNSNLKKIISGLNSIYDGLSNLRNTTGDAHKKKYIPDAHHAQLAVNSAFTLCEFLCSSYSYQQEKKSPEEIL